MRKSGREVEKPAGATAGRSQRTQEDLDGFFFKTDETIESVKMPEIQQWVANAVILSRYSSSIPESEESLLNL